LDIRQAGLEAAAKALGMSADDLSDQLWGGKTLADLAEEANVPLSDVRAAVEEATTTARQSAIKDFVAKQVEDGRMSQEEADWINQGIDNGWFSQIRRFVGGFDRLGHGGLQMGRDFGMGPGRGFGRMRLHDRPGE
jgi:hypothetical protein